MGGGASAPRQPLESLSADNLRELVEGLGPKYADIAKQLQENGYDGAILADASDEDLDELFAELSVSKLQQKVLRKKLVGSKKGISTASLDERPADGGRPAAAAPAPRKTTSSTRTTASCRTSAPTARMWSRACTTG